MARAALAVACATLLLLAASSPATAQTADAEAVAAEGTALFQAGDYAAAIERFQQAFDLDPHPVIMFNMARAYQEMGKLPDALLRFRTVLSLDAPENVRGAASARIQTVEADLTAQGYDPATVTPDTFVPRGTITVVSIPEGAGVYVNGQYRGVTPYVQERVDQGLYALRVELDGYHPVNADFEVRGARNNLRTFTLSPRTTLEAYVPPTPGYLTVRAPVTGLAIEVDGRSYGYTPMLAQPMPPGTYRVSISGPAWVTFSTEAVVESDRETEVTARMQALDERELVDPNRGRRMAGIAMMAGGGALMAGGGAMGVVALGRAQTYRDEVRAEDRAELRTSAKSAALLADVGMGVGAAAFITGAVLQWVGGAETTNVDRELLVTPSFSPGGAMLSLERRF